MTVKQQLRRSLSYLSIVGVFIVIIFLSLIEPQIMVPTLSTEERPDFEFENINVYFLNGGQLEWELKAAYATIDKSEEKTSLVGVHGTVYSDEKEAVRFQSPQAHIEMDTSDIRMNQANAEFAIESRQVDVKAKKIHWSSSLQTLTGSGNVTVGSKNVNLTAGRFEANVPVRRLRIFSDGHATIDPSIL